MANPEAIQSTEKANEQQTDNIEISELKNLIVSKNLEEINKELDNNREEEIKKLGKEELWSLKTAIKNIPGFDVNNNTELNNLYNCIVSICDAFDTDESNPESDNITFENIRDINFENLPDLDTCSIKKVFGLEKQDVVNFFNEQKARKDLTENQKKWLKLTYIWLTRRFFDTKYQENWWKNSVVILQYRFKDTIKIDWKFGIETFKALRSAFLEKAQWSDTNNLKVVSEWKYKGKYTSLETWDFVDKWMDNPTSKKEVSSYKKVLDALKDIKNQEIVYKRNENTTFNFTEKGCCLETSGNVINFEKRGSWLWYYTADNGDKKDDIRMYIKDDFIYIYSISKWPLKKLYYESWAEFDWESDEKGILTEWTMTYPNGTKFEWEFIFDEQIQKVKQWKRKKVDLGNFWD